MPVSAAVVSKRMGVSRMCDVRGLRKCRTLPVVSPPPRWFLGCAPPHIGVVGSAPWWSGASVRGRGAFGPFLLHPSCASPCTPDPMVEAQASQHQAPSAPLSSTPASCSSGPGRGCASGYPRVPKNLRYSSPCSVFQPSVCAVLLWAVRPWRVSASVFRANVMGVLLAAWYSGARGSIRGKTFQPPGFPALRAETAWYSGTRSRWWSRRPGFPAPAFHARRSWGWFPPQAAGIPSAAWYSGAVGIPGTPGSLVLRRLGSSESPHRRPGIPAPKGALCVAAGGIRGLVCRHGSPYMRQSA